MRRIFNLYVNEMIKLSKKPVIFILIGLIFLSSFGISAASKLSSRVSYEDKYYGEYTEEQKLEDCKNSINNIKSQIEVQELRFKSDGNQDNYIAKVQDYEYLNNLALLYSYEFQMKNKIFNSFGVNNTISALAINELYDMYTNYLKISLIPESERTDEEKKELVSRTNNVEKLETIIKTHSLDKYIEYKKAALNSQTEITQEKKKADLYAMDFLKFFYDEEGKSNYNDFVIKEQLNIISAYKLSIDTNRNQAFSIGETSIVSGKVLSQQELNTFKDKLALIEYKMENQLGLNIGGSVKDYVPQLMITFGEVLVVILIIIVAGESISQEMSTGSIKSLIITPTKRYKIYIAKILSILTVLLVGLLVLYISSTLAYGTMFGFNSGMAYYYAVNGVVHTINFYLYNLLYILLEGIPMLFFVFFALMLSTITRNTAAAVGISIAGYFAGTVLTQFSRLFKGEWVKFLPTSNLDIANKVFTQNTMLSQMFSGNQTLTESTSLIFALVYILVAIICFGYIGFDSFSRRDI